ncbi:xyloglucan fucosyltransferase [Marchantia polymorpha subsp. ruderalis]|uniref:Fucosyltransferase n=2 Tax=Marchantia polymorpha TaxID=3197 RepID=A0AAF6B8B1_MARPO|nr:hypothetical protein MARPO_0132s0047 [Marchantia polymorpha]BBN08245.1 hypothetical protein Mp_4g10040 [Marchantia polymorpha subsp. ruderalis]|eukprot:PTQ29974.1 hypothetical protein MARPO_0132s0047 [Marchantia polymorpha]
MDMHDSGRASGMKCYELIINRAVLSLLLLYFGFMFSRTGDLDEMIQHFRKYLSPASAEADAHRVKDDYPLKNLDLALDPEVHQLLDMLKNASREAPPSKGYTRLDRALWDSENSCKSRVELPERYERRKHVENIEAPMGFKILMEQYEKLHRNCIRGSGNLTSLFFRHQSGDDDDGNGCKFLVAEAGNGLGNRVLWMVSTLLYAVLAGRVILIDPRSLIPSLMCEPFSGSSWVAPSEFPFADLRPDLWVSPDEFVAGIDAAAAKNGSNITLPSFKAVRGDDSWGPTSRFYCPMEQHLYSRVKWVTLGGCLYFLPELFAIPTFKLALEATFKNRVPLTHLLRSAMLPRDSVWNKVKDVLDGPFTQADELIGVHVRYRGGYVQYQNLNAHVNHKVHQCLLAGGLLRPGHHPLTFTNSSTLIFISSLYPGLHDELVKLYPRGNEDRVNILQLSSEGEQYSGLQIDEGALVEILSLSLCDAVLISPMSTYSTLAHAYGGMTPWIINFQDDQGPCTRAQALDGCYQGAGVFYVCPLDPAVDKQPIMKLVPSLKPCQDSSGVQLVH